VALQRLMLSNQTRFATDTGKGGRLTGRTSKAAAVPVAAFGVAGVLLPIVGLAIVALSPFWNGKIDFSSMSFDHFTELFDNPAAGRTSLRDSYEHASRVAGAGGLRTHVSIVLPLTRAALSGAAALMFVLLSHEFTASLFVRSSRTQVMGTLLYDTWTTSSYSQV